MAPRILTIYVYDFAVTIYTHDEMRSHTFFYRMKFIGTLIIKRLLSRTLYRNGRFKQLRLFGADSTKGNESGLQYNAKSKSNQAK